MDFVVVQDLRINFEKAQKIPTMYNTAKKILATFPSSAGMLLTKLSLARIN
jgi:hypothetical protein